MLLGEVSSGRHSQARHEKGIAGVSRDNWDRTWHSLAPTHTAPFCADLGLAATALGPPHVASVCSDKYELSGYCV